MSDAYHGQLIQSLRQVRLQQPTCAGLPASLPVQEVSSKSNSGLEGMLLTLFSLLCPLVGAAGQSIT